jgi:hypothetical protein
MHIIFNIGKAVQSSLVVIGFSLFVTSTTWNDGVIFVDAQTTSSLSTPTIQITSHRDGQRVPQGELTIKGISSDNDKTDCQVYADVNDMTPMRNATAAGDTGNSENFSNWTFTYTNQYQLIKEGENELTAKISCSGDTNNPDTPISKWHTVNLTGVSTMAGSSFIPPPSFSSPLPLTGDLQVEDNQREQGQDISTEDGSEEEEDSGDEDSGEEEG